MSLAEARAGDASAHIVIAGGGMVGLSLALMLDRALPHEVRISLIEGARMPPADAVSAPYHPSFDARSTALSYSSFQCYQELGIWADLEPGLGPIERIHVSRRGRFGSSLLEAREQGWPALGWVVENPCLGRVLLAAVQQRPRIELRCPLRVSEAVPEGSGMRVSLDGESVFADLLVIADGAESALREKLGFLTHRKRYAQHALIANLSFETSHGGCAFERFTAEGPLALLPLASTAEAKHRMALVWSLLPDAATQMVECGEGEFAAGLLDAFGQRLGRVLRVGERLTYPLALTDAVEQVRRGCVVLGNAAHALHPVAGQGFNLALRDADSLTRNLVEVIERQGLSGPALGDPGVLSRYFADRQRDQVQTIAASDGLPSLFMHSDPLLSLGRDMALSGLDFMPGLRREFVKQAAGMAALEAAR
ncbi:MAG: 2-octaprenyl-6-methoxyphenyl hydroxylase [Congregibacter sp.]